MKETIEEMLIRHEGLRLFPYKDSKGILTIGVGRNLEDRGISAQEARILLGNDVTQAERDAMIWLGEETYLFLNETRKMVVLDMCFQMGFHRISGFKRLRAAIRANRYADASREILDSKYAREDTPGRAQENATLMLRGFQS